MVVGFVNTFFGYMMASNYKNYGLKYIKDDEYYYLLISLGSIANGASRFFWGFLLDKISFNILVMANLFT
jgi:hypothetical protein